MQDVLYFIDASQQNPRQVAVPGRLHEQIMAEIHGGIMSGHFFWRQTLQDSVSPTVVGNDVPRRNFVL